MPACSLTRIVIGPTSKTTVRPMSNSRPGRSSTIMWPAPTVRTTPVISTGRKKPLVPPPSRSVTVAPSPACGERRDRGRVDQRHERAPGDAHPEHRVDELGAVAGRPAEDGVAGVAEDDHPARLGVGGADRVVGRQALLDLEVGAHRPGEVGQLVGQPLGEAPGRRR